jgi:hypothetical protein
MNCVFVFNFCLIVVRFLFLYFFVLFPLFVYPFVIMVLFSLTSWQIVSCGRIQFNHRSGEIDALSHVIKSGSITVELKDGVKIS